MIIIFQQIQKIIDLSGRSDIKIEFCGLRCGEKLYEELLSDDTKTLPTPNKKIMVSKDPCVDYKEIDSMTKKIVKAALRMDKIEVVSNLKMIVPEFISNNSIFEKLDK